MLTFLTNPWVEWVLNFRDSERVVFRPEGPGRKKGERLHDYALRVQSNVRELAKQRVRLPEQVEGFLLLRRADLSTQARIAIMTLAGNSLSFSDVRKACKRHADEFLRDPKEHDAHKSHTICVSEAKEARYNRGTRKRC